jgi:hypothetical protein
MLQKSKNTSYPRSVILVAVQSMWRKNKRRGETTGKSVNFFLAMVVTDEVEGNRLVEYHLGGKIGLGKEEVKD